MAVPTSIPHLCGSIASKPSDLGVRMHNAAYADLSIPYTYIAFGSDSAESAIASMRTLGISGLSVGVPHKVEVMRFLDEIDPVAQKIGAVNAIVNKEGRLIGYNVDWIGAESALKEAIDIKDKTFLILFYPVETKLVQVAKALGNNIIPGIRMLVYLAAQQFELYTGKKPRFEVMEDALRTGLELKSSAR